MIDARQDKWLRDKLQWIFGFVQLETDPFGDSPYWYRGLPVAAQRASYGQGLEFRTVFMSDLVDIAPDEIEGWKFQRIYGKHSQSCECLGLTLSPGGLVLEGQTVDVSGRKVCPYCEKKQGGRHGTVNLDNKWAEVVYSRPLEEHHG